MVTSHWGSWFQGYSPLGERVGCMTTPCWGRGRFFGLLPAGEVGLMVTSRWGSWFQGYFPLGKLVSGLLPAGGEGGLHDYSPLGERLVFWVTSHWGSWFNGYFLLEKLGFRVTPRWAEGGLCDYSPLGERVWFYDHFSLGMLSLMFTSENKKRKEEISLGKYLKKMKKRAKEGKIKFIQLCFVYPSQG